MFNAKFKLHRMSLCGAHMTTLPCQTGFSALRKHILHTIFTVILFHLHDTYFNMIFALVAMRLFNLTFIVCVIVIIHSSCISSAPPKLMPFNDRIELVENVTYVLTCLLQSSGSQSTAFEWTHNEHKLTENPDVQLDNSPKFSLLTLRNVRPQIAGHFECHAHNSDGSDRAKTTIVVNGLLRILMFSLVAQTFFQCVEIISHVCRYAITLHCKSLVAPYGYIAFLTLL